ncbi:MAG: DUF308 domain-containing protein [Bacteroidales bacterium]|nr:DUF308 domain-containing protein [Bacteroidales bacterium]
MAGIIFVIAGVTLICVDIYYAIKKKLWGTFMFFGALLLVVGIIFALFPEAVRNVLLVIIGIWVVLTGIFQIIATIKFRKRFPQYVMNIINGALMVIIGVVFIFRPELSAKFLTYLISACLIVIGCWELFNAFRFKKVIKEALKADDIEDAEVEE